MKVLTEHMAAYMRELEVSMGIGAIRWHFIEVSIFRMVQLPDSDGFFYDHTDPLSESVLNMN